MAPTGAARRLSPPRSRPRPKRWRSERALGARAVDCFGLVTYFCRRPLWFCRQNPGGARWRRAGRLRGGGREGLRRAGKKRVRSDSRARVGNAGAGGPATSRPSPGVSARVCEKTAVGEAEGAWDGSACRKALGRRPGCVETREAIPKPAEPLSVSVLSMGGRDGAVSFSQSCVVDPEPCLGARLWIYSKNSFATVLQQRKEGKMMGLRITLSQSLGNYKHRSNPHFKWLSILFELIKTSRCLESCTISPFVVSCLILENRSLVSPMEN